MSKNRGHENREQLYGIAKITGGEVEPKIVCKARNYGTWKVTHRNRNRYRRDVLSLRGHYYLEET